MSILLGSENTSEASSSNIISEYCVKDSARDLITTREKFVSLILVLIYLPLLFFIIKNIMKFYEKERLKIYNFMPQINILLFTCVYARIAVNLDGFMVIKKLFSTTWHGPSESLYSSPSILWSIQVLSFLSQNITCSYISTALADLLSAFVTIRQSHLVFKTTTKSIAIVINIFQVMIGAYAIVVGANGGSISTMIILAGMGSTLSLLTISSFTFISNFTKIFKMNRRKKTMIEVGCIFEILRLFYDIILLVNALQMLRIKSCYQEDWIWPMIYFTMEVTCNVVPIFCFSSIFSNKLSLYSQN